MFVIDTASTYFRNLSLFFCCNCCCCCVLLIDAIDWKPGRIMGGHHQLWLEMLGELTLYNSVSVLLLLYLHNIHYNDIYLHNIDCCNIYLNNIRRYDFDMCVMCVPLILSACGLSHQARRIRDWSGNKGGHWAT